MGVKIEVFRVSLMIFTLVRRSVCLNKLYVNRLNYLLENKKTYRSCKRPTLLNTKLNALLTMIQCEDLQICNVYFKQMMVYLSFPVAMFWISNQAEYFEEYIVKRKVHY